MEEVILVVRTKHVKEKKFLRSSQHGFTQGKSCLSKRRAFYDDMARWVDKWTSLHVIYCDFRKLFDTVSNKTLIGDLRKCLSSHLCSKLFLGWGKPPLPNTYSKPCSKTGLCAAHAPPSLCHLPKEALPNTSLGNL